MFKTEFTHSEVLVFMEYSQTGTNLVRLVNPVVQTVIDPLGMSATEEVCSSVWGSCERCENCTALRALQERSVIYKMQLLKDRTFWILSRFMCIDGEDCILEVVEDVTDSLIMDGSQLEQVGRIISSYNHLLVTDSLMNVYNRRFLDDYFVPSLDCRCNREVGINIALMDLDDFKKVNDTYGHQAGDALLKDAAGFWKRKFNSREKEKERLVIRYGGDEILIIARGLSGEEFRSDIESSYQRMRKVCIYTRDIEIPFQVSFGIASSEEMSANWEWDDLLALADKRLYEDKRS